MEKIDIEEFKKLETTSISDALNGLTNMNNSIKPVRDDLKLVGEAYTVKVDLPDNRYLLKAVKEAPESSVIVIDVNGNQQHAICGDFIVGVTKMMGVEGLVIDGVIRDSKEIQQMNYPVFCKGATTAASIKHGIGQINIPITCGDAVVKTGDIIVADVDGVVVVPKEQKDEVLRKAKIKMEKDKEREEKVLKNKDTVLNYIDGILNDMK